MATYMKLKDGSWGVKVQGSIEAGRCVTVTKKSGEIWSGDGISTCAIDSSIRSTSTARSNGRHVCAECRRGGKLVADLEDGMMKHYGCCDIPPNGY